MSTASRLRRERATRRGGAAGAGRSRSGTASGLLRLRYAFDNSMSRGVSALIMYLGAAVVVTVVIFTAIVLIFGVGPTHNPITALYNALLHTLDTGTQANDTGTGYESVDLLVTISGIVIFSAFIGVLATALDERLTDLRKGRSVVLETGHTLILGWSERVFTVVGELAVANESETKPSIVILAERDKVEMEDSIRERVEHLLGTRVVCRTGKPTSIADLELVAHRDARSVIVLGRDGDTDPDAAVIKTILALTTADDDERASERHVVAEIQKASNLAVARLAGGSEVVLVDKPETISRLIVQTSRQSGAAAVYRELLGFDGDEIYMREDASLAGRTYGDALHAYEACAVIGLLHVDGTLKLNPPADETIAPGVSVIAIAEDDSVLEVASPSAASVDEARIALREPEPTPPDSTLVLGYNHRAPLVISELADYAQDGARVVVVADVPAERVTVASSDGMAVEYHERSTTDRAVLDDLAIGSYDRVIVLSYSDDLELHEADARSLVTLLHLRDIAERTGGTFTIVSEVLDEDDVELARVANVDDIIVSDQVLSMMLAQLSENRHLADVFGELFQADGSEVYLRPADHYVAGGEVNFATLVEAARRRGETAIGYRVAAQSRDTEAAHGIRVNPPKSERFTVADGDRLIVLAED
jgi:voltage-gated potassium channel Kch